jgi:hypothetical protein
LEEHAVEARINGSKWTAEMLEEFNKNLLSTDEKFRLENGYIVIPSEAIENYDILINP